MGIDLFLTKLHRTVPLLQILQMLLGIGLRRDPHDILERRHDLFLRDLPVSHGHCAVFKSSGCLDDHMIAPLHLNFSRAEIIDLPGILEFYTYHINHNYPPTLSKNLLNT